VRPAVAGRWRPLDLKVIFDPMAADLRNLAVYERVGGGAVAFADEKCTGDVQHLVRKTPHGMACVGPPPCEGPHGGCSALELVALGDIGYAPQPSKEA
jgi:hypothetical protein